MKEQNDFKTLKQACMAAREKLLESPAPYWLYIYKTKNGQYTYFDYTGNLESTGAKFQCAVDKSGARYIWKIILDHGKKHKVLIRTKLNKNMQLRFWEILYLKQTKGQNVND